MELLFDSAEIMDTPHDDRLDYYPISTQFTSISGSSPPIQFTKHGSSPHLSIIALV